jgi:hypothetical protein
MTKTEFILDIKNHLRNKKNEWYNKRIEVDGKIVGLKFYGKSVQKLEIDGLNYGGLWDIATQKEMIEYITKDI